MQPYVSDPDFVLHVGDVSDVLATLPDESVHCCVTSPPYWGLRDYGAEGQLGLEATPEEYVARMVAVFAEVRRVLRADGTLWLNVGDSYVGKAAGVKSKDLVGIPWRLAFALQADGWYLRSDIIWSKPNPMPESVTDRPTKAHEYLFLLTRSARYFYDADAIREPHSPDGRTISRVVGANGSIQHRDGERWPGSGRNKRDVWTLATESYAEAHFATFPQALVEPCLLAGTSERGCCPVCGAPWRRVVERGESQYSALKGARGWREMAEISAAQGKGVRPGQNENRPTHANHTMTENGTVPSLRARPARTLGWAPNCRCGLSETDPLAVGSNFEIEAASRDSNIEWSASESPRLPMPCVVLDPFMGSGTTALVARRLGRKAVGIELNPEYAELAARRLGQQSLLAEPGA